MVVGAQPTRVRRGLQERSKAMSSLCCNDVLRRKRAVHNSPRTPEAQKRASAMSAKQESALTEKEAACRTPRGEPMQTKTSYLADGSCCAHHTSVGNRFFSAEPHRYFMEAHDTERASLCICGSSRFHLVCTVGGVSQGEPLATYWNTESTTYAL